MWLSNIPKRPERAITESENLSRRNSLRLFGIALRVDLFYSSAQSFSGEDMRPLRAFVVVFSIALSSSIAQTPAPVPAADTNATAIAGAASTNLSEVVILQQLLDKIEKLEQRTVVQDPLEVERLKQRLSDTEAKLVETVEKLDRVRETESESRSTLYYVVFVVAGLAFASVAGLVVFSIYTLRRITQLGEPIFDNFHRPHLPLPHHGHAGALPPPSQTVEVHGHPLGTAPPENAIAHTGPSVGETRLLDAMDRLEKKIEEIEKAAHPDNHVHLPVVPPNGHAPEFIQNHRLPDRVSVLLSKGEALTNLGQFDKAIACLDEAIGLAPSDPAPWVKKGYALEKSGKFEDALKCYDQAIAVDANYSVAYLLKGGVFNRLQRYSEAIECYDRALGAKADKPAQ